MTWSRVPGAVIVLAGLGCALEASTFEVAFMTDPVGPKALPYLVAAILLAAGVHAIIRPPAERDRPSRTAALRAVAATAAFLVYAVALPWVGFFTSTTLVVSALSALFGASPRKGVPAAALLSGALWLMFVVGLGLPLPIGSLWIR